MANQPEVNKSRKGKRRGETEFSVEFVEMEYLELAVLTAEIDLIELHFYDTIHQILFGGEGAAK